MASGGLHRHPDRGDRGPLRDDLDAAARPGDPAVVHAATLDVRGASWTIQYRPETTTNNTAFDLLREASVRLGFPLAYVPYAIPKGIFVTSINGSTNGDGGSYWQYWVNGMYGTVAADHAVLHDGDAVLCTFSVPQEGSCRADGGQPSMRAWGTIAR